MLYHARKLRRFISPDTEYRVRRAAYTLLPARRAPVDAVFHCCTWKTGSQWVRLILSDPRFYMATGLKPLAVFNAPEIERNPGRFQVPAGSVVTNFFVDYQTYANVRKPRRNRAFYVVRDPRELFVSWYLSNRYSHRPTPRIERWRNEMADMSDEDGLIHTVGLFHEVRDRVRSWVQAAEASPDIMLVRFEDLTGRDRANHWRDVLNFLELNAVSDELLGKLLSFYDVKNLQAPTKAGADVRFEKYGSAGKPKASDFLTERVADALNDRFPKLMEDFGYAL